MANTRVQPTLGNPRAAEAISAQYTPLPPAAMDKRLSLSRTAAAVAIAACVSIVLLVTQLVYAQVQ